MRQKNQKAKIRRLLDADFQAQLEREQARWEKETVTPGLNARPERQGSFTTRSGEFPVKRLYSPLDVAELDYVGEVGFPGEFPFTRGIDPSGVRARHWTRWFYTGYGSSEDASQRYLALIKAGANHISLALDLPTQVGLDSDHSMAQGEVGKAGVALDTLDDLERLFQEISLEKVAAGTVGNCIGPWALAMFYALAEKKGIQPSKTKIVLQNDPCKEYSGRGTQIFPLRVAVDLAADVVAFCCRYLPLWEPQYACSTTMRWGGCSVSQEVAFGIANLIAYIEAAKKKGVSPELLVPKMNLHMTADDDLFEEVAKFRATRRLWAKICRDRFETEDPRVLALRITVFTNSTRLTAQQPLNNIVRTTMHVLASILGDAERISVPAYDEALALPTFESTWLANIIKHILTEESMIGNTVDALGGSYYLETLTNQIETEARKCYDHVQAMGGAIEAQENGYYLREMANGMYQYQREVESGERTVIGVNSYRADEEPEVKIFRPDPEAEIRQIARLNDVKSRRDNVAVAKCLNSIREVAKKKASGEDENIVPSMIDAVRAYASVGEIFSALREVFGEFRPEKIF